MFANIYINDRCRLQTYLVVTRHTIHSIFICPQTIMDDRPIAQMTGTGIHTLPTAVEANATTTQLKSFIR